MAVYHFAPRIKSQSFLMLVGKTDERNYTMDEARQIHDLVTSGAKELEIYESGHKLPVEWTRRATEWMQAHLR